ncbi:uncharacterized protein METZ01_LOCUS437709 [marine metagenome]|uniref:Uncharacterized protein n=1 Tax=marine metagenome TaxID=408172 RepID=A0A382YPS1_9ZZZZ
MAYHKPPTNILLASTSPRRRELIARLRIPFESCSPIGVEELPYSNEDPVRYVERMSRLKALSTATAVGKYRLVIGSDTAVTIGGAILGKPSDVLEAESMLRLLRGKTHQVVTSVTLVSPDMNKILTRNSAISVIMRKYSDLEISEYISTGDAMDKAGAYAIQHKGFDPVSKLYGCYTSVVGLPLCILSAQLSEVGFDLQQIPCGTGPDSRNFGGSPSVAKDLDESGKSL